MLYAAFFITHLVCAVAGYWFCHRRHNDTLIERREGWLESLDEADTDSIDLVKNLTRPL